MAKHIITQYLMVSVKTPAGLVTWCADRVQQCPWCKNDWVYLCRDKPKAQWIPVDKQDDIQAPHELHRCEQAVNANDNLRKHMQLKHLSWQERRAYEEGSNDYDPFEEGNDDD